MTSVPPALPGQAHPAFPRRFYKVATAEPTDGGVALLLDGRPARTPGRNAVVVPTRAMAAALADEWNGVGEVVDPRGMPMTRLVNSVIDGVSRTAEAVLDEIGRYANSDLLVYRAPDPVELVATQEALWDPILAWARETLRADLATGQGVMFVSQSRAAVDGVRQALARDVGDGPTAPFRLGALHVMTTLTGSALLALAVATGRLTDAEAWAAAHVDEDHQISLWGHDEEAATRRNSRWRDMHTAARLHRLSEQH
jgi:chaperone required for assembly of F1-ATPase